ncbi:MAG: Gfo/Idh/MocA family oxidoreductase [Desulfotomaculaceae bacterium]|nr:Gfo/Idh/MocA family oxidoreductase [Desulfotomaculaceae bacterium]
MLKKIKFALTGCGNMAAKHAEAIAALPDCELAAVYDIDQAPLQQFAGKYGARAYADYLLLLEDPDLDVISICTPSGLHASMGVAAARAGKNVLVEKPMALSLDDADRLIEACEKAAVTLGVVHQNRFKPAILRLNRAMEEGRFGKVMHANATVRWNRNKDYYEQKTWRRLKDMGGGVLLNQAIHNIDLLQWMMGRVVSVFGYTAANLGLTEGEDVGVAVLRFAGGGLGIVEASSAVYPRSLEETISIFGEKGTVIIGGTSVGEVKVWKFNSPEKEGVLGPDVNGRSGESPLVCCIGDMAQAVRAQRKPKVDGREGRKALEIILAIQQSSVTGKEVVLPLGAAEN